MTDISPERFDHYCNRRLEGSHSEMRMYPNGKWVLFKDYDDQAKRIAELEAKLQERTLEKLQHMGQQYDQAMNPKGEY